MPHNLPAEKHLNCLQFKALIPHFIEQKKTEINQNKTEIHRLSCTSLHGASCRLVWSFTSTGVWSSQQFCDPADTFALHSRCSMRVQRRHLKSNATSPPGSPAGKGTPQQQPAPCWAGGHYYTANYDVSRTSLMPSIMQCNATALRTLMHHAAVLLSGLPHRGTKQRVLKGKEHTVLPQQIVTLWVRGQRNSWQFISSPQPASRVVAKETCPRSSATPLRWHTGWHLPATAQRTTAASSPTNRMTPWVSRTTYRHSSSETLL